MNTLTITIKVNGHEIERVFALDGEELNPNFDFYAVTADMMNSYMEAL